MSMLLLTMGPQLSITRVPTVVTVGSAGAVSFRAVGAAGQVAWTLVSSTLPGEWATSLTVSDGIASITTGAAVVPGTFSVTVRAVDSARQPVIRSFDVDVIALPVSISGSLPAWNVNQPASGSLVVSGGSGTYVSLTVADGFLPPGISAALVGSSVIFGGSAASTSSGSVTLHVHDDTGAVGGGSFGWSVIADPVLLVLSGSGTIELEAGVYDILIVAGGGGGGVRQAGGGGAGGVIYIEDETLGGGVYSYSVGSGGAGGTAGGGNRGEPGANSVFGPWVAVGGGAGGGRDSPIGGSGGSGGGGGSPNTNNGSALGGSGTAMQGYSGGIGRTPQVGASVQYAGGGGGGAGGLGGSVVAATHPAHAGHGGPGIYIPGYDDFGVSGYFAGGGGGGCGTTSQTPGDGGVGGGGGGGFVYDLPAPGTPGTGGGGGGSGASTVAGGSGGSGTIILRRLS